MPPRRFRLNISEQLDNNGEIRKWNSNKATIEFRKDLTFWLWRKQKGFCAYCSLRISSSDSRSGVLDHFVPKGQIKGEKIWTYEIYNLIFCCENCNSKKKKQFNPLVARSSVSYKESEFSIYHPYLDRISDHITGGYAGGKHIPSTPKSVSAKGEATMKLFDLVNPSKLALWKSESDRFAREARQGSWPDSKQKEYKGAIREIS